MSSHLCVPGFIDPTILPKKGALEVVEAIIYIRYFSRPFPSFSPNQPLGPIWSQSLHVCPFVTLRDLAYRLFSPVVVQYFFFIPMTFSVFQLFLVFGATLRWISLLRIIGDLQMKGLWLWLYRNNKELFLFRGTAIFCITFINKTFNFFSFFCLG